MESYIHPQAFGKLIKNERKRLNMNQIAFYNFLFPGNEKEEETIKKKMNKIENGRQKSVDFDMLLAVCQKCDVSADYILGLKNDYRNHANEFVCSYTGLDEKAVRQLHKWNNDKNNGADLSRIGKAFWGTEESEVISAYNKQTATIFLRIINCLFKEGELPAKNNKKAKEPYSNLRILHSLYLLCMAKPKSLTGTAIIDEAELLDEKQLENIRDPYARYLVSELREHLKLDGTKTVFMEDDNDVVYPVFVKDILEQIARRKLDRGLDQLIASVNYEESRDVI